MTFGLPFETYVSLVDMIIIVLVSSLPGQQ